MIVTQFYKGQGLGNQLWCYVTTRIIALRNGYAFGIQTPENFKGIDFMDLDFGEPVIGGNGPEGGPPLTLPEGIIRYYQERSTVHESGADIRMRDERLMTVPDGTKIDGLMQDAELALAYRDQIREWLAIDPAFDRRDFSADDICIINFRGGGYVREKDFFLRADYWRDAVRHMQERNPRFRFVVITDDVKTARSFFPDFEVHHFSIAEDYAVIKNARNLILSNSSFAWFPASVSTDLVFCIAPKFWGRHNVSDGYWSLGYNLTPGWQYLGRDGALYDYEACRAERDAYMAAHENEFVSEARFDPSVPYVPEPPRGEITPPLLRRLRRKIDTAKVLFVRRLREASFLDAATELVALIVASVIKDMRRPIADHPKLSHEELEIFTRLKDRMHVVVDVGAREDIAFYRLQPHAEYHLFELNPRFADRLKRKVGSLPPGKKITVNAVGLSDKPAAGQAYYERSQSLSVNPYMKEDRPTGQYVSVTTLDDYAHEHRIGHIDFLKIDTEGSDYDVLLGGRETIAGDKVSFLQFEYWTGVQKFLDLLGDRYRFYLIMEPVLLAAIKDRIEPLMTPEQRAIAYDTSLIPLDDAVIDLIDTKLAPVGLGGNVLGIHKSLGNDIPALLSFPVAAAKPKAALEHRIAYWLKTAIRKTARLTGLARLGSIMEEAWAKRNWKTPAEIAAYRETIKIYDAFTFFNELDLLEIRLNILDPVVDYFVIVEATETFSGHPKPLYFKENRHRFKKWEHKIIHYVIDDTPADKEELRERLYRGDLTPLDRSIIAYSLTSDNVGPQTHWLKEFYQKECIRKPLVDLSGDDICYVSDVDEIWNPDLILDYSRDDVFKPIQTGYQYFVNNRSDEDWRGWTGTIVTKYKNIRNHCLNHLRTHRKMQSSYMFIRNGGWHFAFQGGYAGARKKIEEYQHDWYQPALPELETRVIRNLDHRGRKIRLWKDERGLPKYLLENRQKYTTFFK